MPQIPETSDMSGEGVLDECFAVQFELCSQLEDLADSLPSKVDTRAAMFLANRLQSTLRRCHRLEETVVFPALSRKRSEVRPILDRLRQEHQEDEDHAADLRDAIRAFVTARDSADAERLGYMLRCLFMSLRRHLAFDRDYVLPLFQQAEIL